MTGRLTLWTSAEMIGEGLDCRGIGVRNLGERLTVHANGMEWTVVVIEAMTGPYEPTHEWSAMDEARYISMYRVEEFS